jgi:hypothetical protein
MGELLEGRFQGELELVHETRELGRVPPLIKRGNGRGDRLEADVLGVARGVIDEADPGFDLGLIAKVIETEDLDLAGLV